MPILSLQQAGTMDYIKEYKSFINSHYLSEGLRMTAGIVLPAVILGYFNLLSAGTVVALGAMSVSITDTPGPIHHRRNGMVACIIINTFISLLTGFANPYPFMLGLLIVIACFIFSMFNVFGNRANSIGVSALLVMVLNIDRHHQGWDVVINTAYITAGGIWYMVLSLLLYSVRPYKLAQQALGDCIIATADYLRIRASFYEREVEYEKTYQNMLQQQVSVHEKQNLVRELLFKSRHVVKESTDTGRTLVMIFTDIIDLFERTMTSYQDYEALHKDFNEDDVLELFRQLILALSNELDEIGIAVKSGNASEENGTLAVQIKKTKTTFDSFRNSKRTAENVQGFISLRHILNSIEDIAARVHILHLYTTYDKALTKKMSRPVEYDKFITHKAIDLKELRDNLSLQSNIFRHAVRTSIATLTGFIISLFFPLGHSYWILLTIIVILKPAYSLTRKRNYERLIGTIAGAVIGLIILYFIHDNHVLFFIMLLLMIGTYSLLRTHYMWSVIFMTPYILLLFHLLSNGNFQTLILDRVTDTAIGSAIAFVANIILLPAWEHEQIKNYMLQSIKDNKDYFTVITGAFIYKPFTTTQYKLSRKNAFVALANLSDAFTRMLSEPKRKQKNIKLLHQFVVLNHMLTSHIATLSYYVKPLAAKYASTDFIPVINHTITKFEEAEKIINNEPAEEQDQHTGTNSIIDKRVEDLLEIRKNELQHGITESETRKNLSELKSIADQFNFITSITTDIKKASIQLIKE